MKICYFGDYDPEYIRNDVILTGLREAGVSIIVRNMRGRFKILRLFASLFSPEVRGADILLVGSSDTSRPIVIMARLLWWRPLVWDMHYSLYDALVNDRELVHAGGMKAAWYYVLEWVACRASTLTLLDTDVHAQYIRHFFGLSEMACSYVLTGANERRLHEFLRRSPPARLRSGKDSFVVSFHGKYIPLQGVEYIVEAAKILASDTRFGFVLVGRGQTFDAVRARALDCSNITFVPRIPYDRIPQVIKEADVSLGIFGSTGKARRVIPNKLYEAVALGVAVVTGDSPAIREVFTGDVDIVLCKMADPADLAMRLRQLADDPAMRDRIAQNGYATFQRMASVAVTGSRISGLLSGLLH
jgi:glycosyltransferase involved in cell wall biosynthesis